MKPKIFFEELLSKVAETKDLGELMNAAARKWKSTHSLDKDLKILAYSTIFQIEDALWRENLKMVIATTSS